MFKIDKSEQRIVEVFEGVLRHTLACGMDVLMARFEYKAGSAVPPHKHSYEQVTTLLKGKQLIVIMSDAGTEEIIVKAGDSYIVPANFEHKQKSLADTITIDAWSLAP